MQTKICIRHTRLICWVKIYLQELYEHILQLARINLCITSHSFTAVYPSWPRRIRSQDVYTLFVALAAFSIWVNEDVISSSKRLTFIIITMNLSQCCLEQKKSLGIANSDFVVCKILLSYFGDSVIKVQSTFSQKKKLIIVSKSGVCYS